MIEGTYAETNDDEQVIYTLNYYGEDNIAFIMIYDSAFAIVPAFKTKLGMLYLGDNKDEHTVL